jgi:hypothetical protein
MHRRFTFLLLAVLALLCVQRAPAGPKVRRLLYVALPGIRNYLEFGGVGIAVFDIDAGHRFVKRIPTPDSDPARKPSNVKGVCASARTGLLYVSTLTHLTCLDLRTEKVLWERPYEGGCDRMSLSPDGKVLYLPSLEAAHWHVVDALSGGIIKKLVVNSKAHNTVYGSDGKRVYLAGLGSPYLNVAETQDHTLLPPVGPFSAAIRPFTVNRAQTLAFVNVNDLLGFEVGDLRTRKALHRVEVAGFPKGPVKRHGCPSHGVGLTPDEKELWVVDAFNQRVHIFDATRMPPVQRDSIVLREQPGWVTFTLKGDYAYPSTGDVIETKMRRIVTGLTDETGRAVGSEKMLEIQWEGDRPVRNGDQFGIGRAG